MFSFFKSKKANQDPLKDLKTISRWMEELPIGDQFTAQERVVQSLIQFNHSNLHMSRERLEVLMHLDEQTRDMQQALCTQYLRNPRMSRKVEVRLWTAIYAYYWEVTRGYHAFLMDYVAKPGGSKIRALIPTISARAIRGFADIFKLRYFRYERIEKELWPRLHNLYRISEFEGFQGNRFKPYPSDTKTSSCLDEYIQALLLEPLGEGNLSPKQIEMVDLWLDRWSEFITLERAYDPERHFFMVDMATGRGIQRIRPNTTPEPSHGYLSTIKLLDDIREIERKLKLGALPAALGLGEEFRLPEGYDLLSQVSAEWGSDSGRERRTSQRDANAGTFEVIRDLPTICKHILAERAPTTEQQPELNQEAIQDIQRYGFVLDRKQANMPDWTATTVQDKPIQYWLARDKSETGIGLKVPIDDSEGIKLGKLLALKAGSDEYWRVGAVRRIEKPDRVWCMIGLKTISNHVIPALLEREQLSGLNVIYADNPHATTDKTSNVLQFTSNDKNFLIMEAANYSHGRTCKIVVQDYTQHIRLREIHDKGDNWLVVSYT